MKVYVIGSMSQEREIKDVANKYEKMGCDVRYVKKEFDNLTFDLIRNTFLHIESWAYLIVVVPKSLIPLSFGDGVMYEIEHAKSFSKPVVIHWD